MAVSETRRFNPFKHNRCLTISVLFFVAILVFTRTNVDKCPLIANKSNTKIMAQLVIKFQV